MVKFRNTKRRLKRFAEKIALPIIGIILPVAVITLQVYCYYSVISVSCELIDEYVQLEILNYNNDIYKFDLSQTKSI